MSKRNQEQDYYYEDEYDDYQEYYPPQKQSMWRDVIKTSLIIVAIIIGASILSLFILDGQDAADTNAPSSYTSNNGKPSNYKPTNSNIPGTNKPDSGKETQTPESSDPDSKLTFDLIGGESNQYARWIVYNEGTECEEKTLAYYIPAGKYSVKNIGTYPGQVNVYSNSKTITDAGWEEPRNGYSKSLNVGETTTITIGKNQHIELISPDKFQFTKIGEAGEISQESSPVPSNPSSVEKTEYRIINTYATMATNSIGTTYMQAAVVIENTGNTNLYLGYASFDIETQSGELIASESDVTGYPQVIAPGERGVYFDAFSNDSFDTAQAYRIVPHLYAKKATVDLVRFEYSDIKIQEGSYGVYIDVLGRVHNNTTEDESMTMVVVICYDKDGNVIDVMRSYEDYAAGEKKGFEMSHYPRIDISIEDIASYDVYVYPHQYQFN